MEIAIIAADTKKELMTQFCIAYCGILSKHNLCATNITAKYISEATGLHIERMLTGGQGGEQQIATRIAYNEMDMVLFFVDPKDSSMEKDLLYISRLCDENNIPFASNVATAEMLVLGMDRGDLDWRNIVNPKYRHNR